MDSTIIQEIANQLGIAVDQAGQFIVDYLPQYAAMKTVKPILFIAITAIILIASFIVFAIYNRKAKVDLTERKKAFEECENHIWSRYPSFEDSFYGNVAIVSFCALCVAFLVLIIGLFIAVPSIIGWSNYPEAMLIDMALKAVS